MLGWLQQTFAGNPLPDLLDAGRVGHPVIGERFSAMAGLEGDALSRRTRKRFESRPRDADELYRAAAAAGGTAALDAQEQERAAVAF